MKKRDGFNKMIEDALDGKIHIIITKSISRFARNTVDSLSTIRKLKERGIAVIFEKEGINTLEAKGELLITILSSLAQEEARSISENVTWGMRKRFADGKVTLPYKRFLGYRKGPDGQPEIVEEEAATVRLIYKLFLYGKTPYSIAKCLNGEGIASPSGKSIWRTSVVESILTNEKYRGSALLQKKFTTDFLTKKQKVNEGEVPQYYVEVSHPAIVEPALFDLVQHEHAKMKAQGRPMSGVHCFSGRIFCGECGGMYGSKVWNSGSKYRRVVWQCNEKRRDSTACAAPHVTEDLLRRAFVIAFNAALKCKSEIIAEYRQVTEAMTDATALTQEAAALQEECDVVVGMLQRLVQENAHIAQDQEEYQKRYAALNARYEDANARLNDTKGRILEQAAKRANILTFLETLDGQDGIIEEFDEELWYRSMDRVQVWPDKRLVFIFRDGSEYTVPALAWMD